MRWRAPSRSCATRSGRSPSTSSARSRDASMRILATGHSGPVQELERLRAAGHEGIAGRPLDTPGRRAYTEAELAEACRDVDVVLASSLESITARVMEA